MKISEKSKTNHEVWEKIAYVENVTKTKKPVKIEKNQENWKNRYYIKKKHQNVKNSQN